MGTYDRFTRRAKQVLSRAQEEARHFNHPYVGTEHLLLGLIREREGVAGRVLEELGLQLETVRDAVRSMVGLGEQTNQVDELVLTARAKQVIERSIEEAGKLNHRYIGTEHLLLGLVRNNDGVAISALTLLNVSPQALHERVMQLLRSGSSIPPPTNDN